MAIHSEIPDEEQAEAFKIDQERRVVKVIIATNAAESSITVIMPHHTLIQKEPLIYIYRTPFFQVPDVDHVICLGVHKQVEYNAAVHRTMLSPLWISRASAVQRAGRTGRTRPGTVYRLYSRALFESKMEAFDSGEMARQPLDGVIVQLRSMLDANVVPILESVLTPPPLEHVGKAFESLFSDGLLSAADDDGVLTSLGGFVAKLGLDLRLGRLIGLGAMFGVLPEAVSNNRCKKEQMCRINL